MNESAMTILSLDYEPTHQIDIWLVGNALVKAFPGSRIIHANSYDREYLQKKRFLEQLKEKRRDVAMDKVLADVRFREQTQGPAIDIEIVIGESIFSGRIARTSINIRAPGKAPHSHVEAIKAEFERLNLNIDVDYFEGW